MVVGLASDKPPHRLGPVREEFRVGSHTGEARVRKQVVA
jgi:hypothetical protein